jgi:nicotinamidase-related amidase
MTGSTPSGKDHPLLLCIDLQPTLLKVIPGSAEVLRRCCFAVEAAKGFGLPLLFTEQAPAKLGPAAPELLALVDQPVVLAKDDFSALANGPVQAAIRAGGARHLLLGGVETPVCVFQTARDALEAGLTVTLLSDCVGGRRGEDAAAALRHLEKLGANLLPVETVFYALLQSARHPFFRDLTRLVKKYS